MAAMAEKRTYPRYHCHRLLYTCHHTRLLEADETEGPTYAVQYHAESKAFYNRYIELFAESMRKKAMEKWGDQFIAFRSVLEVVN